MGNLDSSPRPARTAAGSPGRAPGYVPKAVQPRGSGAVARRPLSPRVRRRRWVFSLSVATSLFAFLAVLLAATGLLGAGGAIETGPKRITGITQPDGTPWSGAQPEYGVDVSFPQCGRRLGDLGGGYAIVGLDGGMPDRPNPCFAQQWRFALRQAGAAVYVNTADNGRGDPRDVGRRAAEGDLDALSEHDVPKGTPVWLDVELPEVWNGAPARHRAVITEHLRVLAAAGHPVGIYSAPALWQEITDGARVDVPTWVGIGTATRARAARVCAAESFGGRGPAIVQRIGTGRDGRPLDRNITCPGTDLTGLIRPN